MSVFDDLEDINGVGDYKDFYVNKYKMKEEATNNLKTILGSPVSSNYDMEYGIVDDLQELGIHNYESFMTTTKLENSTINKYLGGTSLGDQVNKATSTVLPLVDTVTGLTSLASKAFLTNTYKNSLDAIPPSTLDDTIGKKDPISGDVDLRTRIYNIAERCGFVQSKVLSIAYSRNYVFTSRPSLASDESGKYHSFVFFTRPNLNLVSKEIDGSYKLNPSLSQYPSLYHLVNSDPILCSELCRESCNGDNLFYLLSNYVKEVPPIRLTETERSGIENMYGYSTPVAGPPEYHDQEVTITMNDNYRGDVAKLLYVIGEYRHNTSKRGLAPLPEYSKYNADDTLISMYLVTTNSDMEIVGFGVGLNGVISDVPSHFTQHKSEGFTKEELLDNFSFTIKFSTFYPHKPEYYQTFNYLFKFDKMNAVNLKGSMKSMMAPGRETDPSVTSTPTMSNSLGTRFGIDLGGIGDRITSISRNMDSMANKFNTSLNNVQQEVNKYTEYVDKVKDMATNVDAYSIIKSVMGDGKSGIGTKINTNTLQYRYKNYYEFLAKHPGIYISISGNEMESSRLSFRLGFSY